MFHYALYVADACRIRIPMAHVANKTTQDDVSELTDVELSLLAVILKMVGGFEPIGVKLRD